MAKINALKLKSALTKFGEQIKKDPENAAYHLTEAGYSEDEATQIIAKANEGGAPEQAKPEPKKAESKAPAKKSLQPTYERWSVERVKVYDEKKGAQVWAEDENGEPVFEKVKLIRSCKGEPAMIEALNGQAKNTKEFYYLVD